VYELVVVMILSENLCSSRNPLFRRNGGEDLNEDVKRVAKVF